jgi:hypothetical protein
MLSDAYRRSQQLKAAEGRKKMLTVGIPMVLFTVGGCYMLSIFLETHVALKDKQNKSTTTRKFDLEEEHKALMEKLDLDSFSLSRIPRPAEETDPTKAQAADVKKK